MEDRVSAAARWGIVGHERQVDQLERVIGRGAVAHAYLIAGPPRVGKSTLALRLAARLACVGANPPCGACRPCRTIAAGTFPDVSVVEPLADAADDDGEGGKKRWITIAQVRELQRQANLSPYESPRKVFILLDAENLQGPASDALLKTLEEPPARAVLILTARDVKMLPATVASRCQIVLLPPVPETTLEAALRERGCDGARAGRVARLARGRTGWALEALGDPGLVERQERALDDWVALMDARSPARLAFAQGLEKQFKQDRTAFEESVQLWLGWWRDLLLVRADCPELIVNADRAATLRRWSETVDVGGITTYLETTLATVRRLGENAQPRLALEALLMSIPAAPVARR